MLKKDLKKHLLRAKQLAEQNFGRADKSEVLSEDLEQLDKRINHIRQACHNVTKKVVSAKDSGADKEKRLRKLPEQQLAQQMIDSSSQLGTDTLMGGLFLQCGTTQANIARELVDYQVEVETRVLAPLHIMAEQEIPTIQRKKKQLEKLVLDYDTARSRFVSSQEKYRDQAGGGGATKTDAAKSEMEEALIKVEQCRDQLSTDMLAFHAKEAENSKFLIDLIKVQADYHEKALKVLQQAIPRMEEICDHNQQLPVYGTPLEEHLQRTNREIASVIEICIAILAEEALEEEGLFRIAGGSSKVKKVKAALDVGRVPDMEEIRDIHCIAGALKLYLRELPEPLLTYNLYNEWMQATHLSHDEKMQTLWVICGKLPKPNYNNLRYLIKFLGKLAEKSDINKMSPSNIAIVLGPNLLWPKDSGQNVLTTASQSSLAESLIAHADYFFPGDIDFGLSNASERSTPPGTLNRPPSTGHVVEHDTSSGGSDVSHTSPNTHNHPTLSKSMSGNNLVPENSPVQDSSSPVVKKKFTKKPAPLPPTADKSSSLERKAKPPVSTEKPAMTAPSPSVPIAPTSVSGEKPSIVPPGVDHKPPPIPDRPTLGPPPAVPNKPQSPTEAEHQLGGGIKAMGNPPLSPGKPKYLERPTMAPPEKPPGPAYDRDTRTNNGGSGAMPYGVKPGDSSKSEGSSSVSMSVNNVSSEASNTAGIGSPVSSRGGSIKTPGSKPPPRPNPPPKHGSRGSDKDFQFVKDDLAAAGQQIARKRSTKEEDVEKGDTPPVARQESKNVETHL